MRLFSRIIVVLVFASVLVGFQATEAQAVTCRQAVILSNGQYAPGYGALDGRVGSTTAIVGGVYKQASWARINRTGCQAKGGAETSSGYVGGPWVNATYTSISSYYLPANFINHEGSFR